MTTFRATRAIDADVTHAAAQTRRRRSIKCGLAALGTGAAVLLAACSSSSGAGSQGGPAGSGSGGNGIGTKGNPISLKVGSLGFDPKKYCGTKPMKVGLMDGFAPNTWRYEVLAMNRAVLAACKNVTTHQYYNSNLNEQNYANQLNVWASQQFNVVYAYPDFGPQSNQAFKQAQRRGMKIGVDYLAADDVVPDIVSADVAEDYLSAAKTWVPFFDQATNHNANILVIGGPAGNTEDPAVVAAIQQVIQSTGAKVKLLQTTPVVGNWDTATTAQAMSAAIAKYPNLNGVVATSIAVEPAIVRAFRAAGRPLPALAGQGSDNQLVCDLHSILKTDPTFNLVSIDASGNAAPLALIKAIAAYQGIKAPELGPTDSTTYFTMPTYINTLTKQLPECSTSVPASADLSMALTPEQIANLK